MKKLSKVEFQEECKTLELKGKCTVLLNGNISIGKCIADKDTKIEDLSHLSDINSTNINGLLVNFKVSPNFLFFNFGKIMFQILKYTNLDLDVVVTVTYDKHIADSIANITILSMKKKISLVQIIEKVLKPFKKYLIRSEHT